MIYGFIFLGYGFGSIPFGLLVTKWAGLGDIRDIGSGNIGTTNVLRTGHKKLAALTLLFDMLKGLAAVLPAMIAQDPLVLMATALAAVLGHMYPVWLGFKGGKGVATGLGVMLGLSPLLGFIMILIWIGTALMFRISSLAALTAFFLSPILAGLVFDQPSLAILSAIIAVLVFWRHRENIDRLFKGRETRF